MRNKTIFPNLVAFAWGLAEATCFFIVPDVYISYRALSGLRPALIACAFALVGALVGGTLIFLGAAHGSSMLGFVQHVPGITAKMVVLAHADYAHHGVAALLIAPTRGIPYKLYSAVAPSYDVSYGAFLAVSLVARLIRFLLVAVIVAGLSKLLGRWLGRKQRLIILLSFWTVFYAIYFIHIGQ